MLSESNNQKVQELANELLQNSGAADQSELVQRERPMRILNKIAIGFPYQLIFEISPYAAKYLRQLIKLPMILILNCCGIQTGINLVTFTFLGELLKSGTFTESIGLILFLGAIAAFSSVFLLFTLNFINSRYD